MRRVNELTPFGMAVKKRAIEKNVTMAELAQAVGLKQQYLSRILSGDRPGYKYRVAIVLELDMPNRWLEQIA